MSTITPLQDIEAWQAARELTRVVYKHTTHRQAARYVGLTSPMQRAWLAVWSNRAIGFESRTQLLSAGLIMRSKASAGEIHSQMYAATDHRTMNYEFNNLNELGDQCIRQIFRFSQKISQPPQAIPDEGIEYNV
jgi:four helix bundle protein